VGIDYHNFIDSLKNNKTDQEMAQDFGVSDKTITGLRNRFYDVESKRVTMDRIRVNCS
jgi:hypothetical protein